MQAVDDNYQPTRTSTFRLPVQPEGVCEFPPVEKDKAKAAAIRVTATNRKQGKKLDDGFVSDWRHVCPSAVGSRRSAPPRGGPGRSARSPRSRSRAPSCPSPRASRCGSW